MGTNRIAQAIKRPRGETMNKEEEKQTQWKTPKQPPLKMLTDQRTSKQASNTQLPKRFYPTIKTSLLEYYSLRQHYTPRESNRSHNKLCLRNEEKRKSRHDNKNDNQPPHPE